MKRLIAICYVGWAFDFYDLYLFSLLLPDITRDLGLTPAQTPWLLGIGLGTSGLGGILFGWLADRVGRKPVMTWTILVYSAGTAACALTSNVAVFFILRGIAGLGIGGEWAAGHALVAESVPAERRGRASALLQSGEPVGVALAAIVGLRLTGVIGWRMVLLLSGLTALWALIVRRHLPESALWASRRSRTDDVRRERAWLASPSGLWTALRAMLLASFKLGTYWTCYIWLPKFFLERFHQPIGRTLVWILTAQVGQFAGMMVFGAFADRYGRRLAYTVYSTLTAVALATLAFRWEFLVEHQAVFWPTMLLLGFGSGCTAGFGALLSELFPTEVRNFAMGTVYNVARGAQLLAPVVVSFFAARYDVAGALGVPLVLAALTAVWVWTLPETRTRDLAHFNPAGSGVA